MQFHGDTVTAWSLVWGLFTSTCDITDGSSPSGANVEVADPWQAAFMADFAEDLRGALVDHYAGLDDGIEANGIIPLKAAQEAIDVAAIVELNDSEDDPYRHDLARVRVFRHPDVVAPRAGVVWFGAYRRDTGTLIEIYRSAASGD